MPLILIACDFVSMYPSHSQKGKNIYFILSGQDNLSNTFVRSISLLTVAMATERSPIKVPCENEDLPDKENAPDSDEDTLRGELGLTSASVIVRTIYCQCKQMWRTGYILCMGTLKDIWPVMTLFYDNKTLFIERISEAETFVIFFSDSSKQVHKVIISKGVI